MKLISESIEEVESSKRVQAKQLLENLMADGNEELVKFDDLFSSKPHIYGVQHPNQYTCIKILASLNQMFDEHGFLNAKQLLSDGYLILSTDCKGKMIPFET